MILVQQQAAFAGLTEKIALAVLGVALGFVSAYLLDRIKARREPRRRISWDVDVERAHMEVMPSIQSKVRVLYQGEDVAELTHVRCRISNTGNRVIKEQELRFTFPKGAALLEAYFDPEPEPELGLELIADSNPNGRSERRYRIGHFERDESVIFNFVTTGGDFQGWEPRPFNKDGNPDFVRGDVAMAKDDGEHVRPFLLFGFLALIVPEIVAAIPLGSITGLALAVTWIALLALLAPHLMPVIRVAHRLVTRQLESRHGMTTDVQVQDGASIVVGGSGSIQGGLHIGVREAAATQEQFTAAPSRATTTIGENQ